MPLTVDVVTAERSVVSEEGVDEIVVPGIEGELAVLPMHAPLLTMVKPGVMRIKKGSEETELAITGGFLEVRDDRVTILADAAERAEEIDVAAAEEARRRAEQQLADLDATEVDLARVSAELQRALLRLKVAERRRRRSGTRPGPPGV
jgi:F-type H+-transporting ATPase subunit epsilon